MKLMCVIDTETTGLPDDPDAAVIEVAATVWDVERNAEVRCWSTLVKPRTWGQDGRRIAQEVCGIDPDLVDAYGESPVFALMRLLDFCKMLPLHAWNRPFDEEMIRRMDPSERRLQRDGLWGDCLMREFSAISRGNPDLRSKLTFAYEQCGFQASEAAHRALADARMAARVIGHVRNGGALDTNKPKGPSSYPSSNPSSTAGKRRWTSGGMSNTVGGAG